MNLNEKFMSEWREDAEMADDLMDEARKIPILHCKMVKQNTRKMVIDEKRKHSMHSRKLYKRKVIVSNMGKEKERNALM